MSRETIVDNDYITFYIDEVHGSLYAHVNIHTWSHNVYKACLRIWVAFLQEAKSKGHEYVYAVLSTPDDRLHKFAALFNMFEIERNDRYTLMGIAT